MSKRTSIRIPDELYSRLTQRAAREHRTVSNLIIVLLSEAVDREARNVATNVAEHIQDNHPAAS